METIGIIGALNEELSALRRFVDVRSAQTISGFSFIAGTLEERPVVIAQTGIGKVNAALCTQILISDFHVDKLLFIGVGGGLNRSLEVGDTVVSTATIQHDLDLTVFGRALGEAPTPFAGDETSCPVSRTVRFAPADPEMIATVQAAYAKLPAEFRTKKLIPGLIASGDTFISLTNYSDSYTEADILKSTYSAYLIKRLRMDIGADCVEMEGAAFGYVCMAAGKPFVVVRCISDLAGVKADVQFDQFVAVSSEILAQLAVGFVREMALRK